MMDLYLYCKPMFVLLMFTRCFSSLTLNNRDRQNMGSRYLEVFQGKRADYYAAIASVSTQEVTSTSQVILSSNAWLSLSIAKPSLAGV